MNHSTAMPAQVFVSTPNRSVRKKKKKTFISCCIILNWQRVNKRTPRRQRDGYSHYAQLDLNAVAVLLACFNLEKVIRINCRIICGNLT